MYILVYDNQISGYTDDPAQAPSGFQVYFYDGFTSLNALYFDGQQVLPKPPQPDPSAYWDMDHWVTPQPEPVATYEPFSDSPLFQAAWEKAQTDTKTLAIFATALYADTKGDRQLLEHCQSQLEDLLTEP